jgi:hypothetical protein
MKSTLILVLATLFFSTASFAQLTFGIKGGANITKVEGKSFSEEFRYGYHLGGFATIKLAGRLGIQPEVLFNQYNTRVDSSFKSVYSNALSISNYQDVKLNYLTIPILLNYKLANIISLQAGPQFGVLISQDKNLLQNGQEAFKNGELSLVGGVQLNLSKFRLSGRYLVGLNNISDVSSQNKWKNQGFQLSVGLAL